MESKFIPKKLRPWSFGLFQRVSKAYQGSLVSLGIIRGLLRVMRISPPITQLLKNDSFGWNEVAQKAFERLKEAMTTVPVLAALNFEIPFEAHTDASG